MENIKEAVEGLKMVKTKILELLAADNVGEMVTIRIGTQFDSMINSLSFLSGTLIDSAPITFEPITNFMGEELTIAQPVVENDLIPEENEKTAYVEKVDTLQKNIAGLENSKILESYTTLLDILVIRGVAKRAGLEDFQTAEITGIYLDQIREGLTNKAAAEIFKIAQDADIDQQNPD